MITNQNALGYIYLFFFAQNKRTVKFQCTKSAYRTGRFKRGSACVACL